MWQTLADVLRASWEPIVAGMTAWLPRLLAGLLILASALLMGFVGGRLTTWALRLAKIDLAASRLGLLGPLSRVGIPGVASLAGRVVQWSVVGAALIPVLYLLDPGLASDLTARSLLYLPHLIVAVAILWAGFVLSRFLGRGVLIASVNAGWPPARLLAGATRTAVMLVAGAVAFEHLGIGRATVLTAFAILFGGVTLAAALAVGLGSQDVVRRWWEAEGADRASRKERPDPIDHW